ncbi:hypothetical protein KM043_018789 [Ampulex compressa]|nr:hypothetical protein KM043_018789 [Ampulex compressa]
MYYHIAERDGLQLAFNAYKSDFSLRKWKDFRLPGLEQYNHLQLFFLAYANAHCASSSRLRLKTVEELSRSIIEELDKPARRKVLLSLLQVEAFGKVFKCKKGSWMYPVRGAPYW